jgi:general stress protein 26
MDEEIRRKILTLLDQHRIMTIATLRPDGWPQATTVGYANEGLTLYFLCGPDGQKAANLARDDRVSLTIDHDTPHDRSGEGHAFAHAEVSAAGFHTTANADPGGCLHMTPMGISVLDYSKGFAHTDLVTC